MNALYTLFSVQLQRIQWKRRKTHHHRHNHLGTEENYIYPSVQITDQAQGTEEEEVNNENRNENNDNWNSISYNDETGQQQTRRRRPQRQRQRQQQQRPQPRPLPFLYSLSKNWAWPAVAHRAETFPEEANGTEYRDPVSGDTVLHWTCFGSPPLYVVEALLRADPNLPKIWNGKGELPLHVACSYRAAPSIIRALVKAYPESAGMPNQKGSYPLHLLCDYGCSSSSIEAILETSQGMESVIKHDTIYGRKPLLLLNERKNFHQFHGILDELRYLRQLQQDEQEQQQENSNSSNSDSVNENDIDSSTISNSNSNNRNIIGNRNDEGNSTKQRIGAIVERLCNEEFWKKASLLVLCESRLLDVRQQQQQQQEVVQQRLEEDSSHEESETSSSTTTKTNTVSKEAAVEAETTTSKSTTTTTTTTTTTMMIVPSILEQPICYDYLIHACLVIEKCPPTFLELAILLRADDELLKLHPRTGSLPLHIATARLFHTNNANVDSTIMDIITAKKEACAIANKDGQLPLKIFLQTRRQNKYFRKSLRYNGVLEALISANPLALETIDFIDYKLYPYIWSKLIEKRNMTAIYQAIYGNPSYIMSSRSCNGSNSDSNIHHNNNIQT